MSMGITSLVPLPAVKRQDYHEKEKKLLAERPKSMSERPARLSAGYQ